VEKPEQKLPGAWGLYAAQDVVAEFARDCSQSGEGKRWWGRDGLLYLTGWPIVGERGPMMG
jgi:hypothetical protein